MEKPKMKLRPIVYTANYFKRGHQNTAQQMMLLKALQITTDPDKLKKMIEVRSVAEVYRTLDKLALRKEYHEALSRSGISFDYIVRGIKDIADNGVKDNDRLGAFRTLLTSVGMEKYDGDGIATTGTWEEVLMKKIEENKNNPVKTISEPGKIPQYDVKVPEIPESARLAREEEDEITASVYDTDLDGKI